MVGFNVAVSGVSAAEKRFDAAAANIVHAHDTAPPRKEPIKPVSGGSDSRRSDDDLYRPVDVYQSTVEGGGTKAQYVERTPARETAYAPDSPKANDQGLVEMPRVDVASELVNTILAQQAYEAAVKAIQARNQTLGTTIDARS